MIKLWDFILLFTRKNQYQESFRLSPVLPLDYSIISDTSDDSNAHKGIWLMNFLIHYPNIYKPILYAILRASNYFHRVLWHFFILFKFKLLVSCNSRAKSDNLFKLLIIDIATCVIPSSAYSSISHSADNHCLLGFGSALLSFCKVKLGRKFCSDFHRTVVNIISRCF